MSRITNSTPLILCGPIVRRVEPRQAAVWIALKSAAAVELSVWEGLAQHDDIDGLPLVGKVQCNTVQIGKHLHLAVANLELEEGNLLQWKHIYSYNLRITPDGGSPADLKSMGLLDAVKQGESLTALSYAVGQLPSFALPADEIAALKILHGSCRNNDVLYEDALAWVDDFIKNDLEEAEKRPQQLFLSGDQIYADSVVGTLLHELTQWGDALLEGKETLPTEWGSDADTGKAPRWKADNAHFPAYFRDRLVDSEARFTTMDKTNHLLSFGEFAAMYLSVWSPVPWVVDLDKDEGADAACHFDDVFGLMEELPENYGAIFRRNLTDERTNKELDIPVEAGENPITAREIFEDAVVEISMKFLLSERQQDKEAFKSAMLDKKDNALNRMLDRFFTAEGGGMASRERKIHKAFFDYFKEWAGTLYAGSPEREKAMLKTFRQGLPKVRRALANISTYMIFDDHEITDDWNLNPSWRDRVHASYLGRAIVRNGLASYALFQDWGNRPGHYNRQSSGMFDVEDNLAALIAELNLEQYTDTLKTAFDAAGIVVAKENASIKILHSEEWLLKDGEKKDEYIIRKYKLLRGAGEEKDVLRILKNPHAFLLKQVPKLFVESGDGLEKVEGDIDFVLGLDHYHRVVRVSGGRYQLPDNRSPLIKWHYAYEGAAHRVLVIDNRTRRSFVSWAGAPGNLSFNGMKDLIPENPEPQADEVLFVVAPLPVIGPSLLDELIGPLAFKAYDLVGAFADTEPIKSGMKGTNPDAIEAWAFDPVSQEELLRRLAPFQRIVLLSGDVHYAASQRLQYWKKGADKPACFAQLTSSGLRNVMPAYIQHISQHYGAAQKLIRGEVRAERLGWHEKTPKPLVFEEGAKVNAFLKYKLNSKPVIIPTLGWPASTAIADGREPDWAWRAHNVWDVREESERPALTRLAPLVEGGGPAPAPKSVEAFRKIAGRHSKQVKKVNFTRQILFKANIGLVAFEKPAGGLLQLTHNLFAAPYEAKAGTVQKPALYTLHRIPMEAAEDDQPPTFHPQNQA